MPVSLQSSTPEASEIGAHHDDPNKIDTALDHFPYGIASPESQSFFWQRRKRKRESIVTVPDPPKKQRQSRRGVNERYIELLNEVVLEVNRRNIPYADTAVPSLDQGDAGLTIPIKSHGLSSTQLGISFWSVASKKGLFSTLTSCGRHDLDKLGSIAQKSIPEVNSYLCLLQKGVRIQQLRGRLDRDAIDLVGIPAAVEIENEVEKVLEEVGDHVEETVRSAEEEEERGLWGNMWLIDAATAEELEKVVSKRMCAMKKAQYDYDSKDDDEMNQETFLHHASSHQLDLNHLQRVATLLNFPVFLKLSHRIFMNPGSTSPSPNWFFLSSPLGSVLPSIRATACCDLFTLVVELTRKIISTAIFQATSRLRATDCYKGVKQPTVKESDVATALEVLGMKSRKMADKEEYWVGVARRNHLRVFDVTVRKDRTESLAFRKDLKIPMAYHEVERRLRDNCMSSRSTESPASNIFPVALDGDDTQFEFTDSEDGQVGSTPAESIEVSIDSETDSEDEVAAALDAAATTLETQRLWKLLKVDPPAGTSIVVDHSQHVRTGDTGKPTKKPRVAQKDWRNTIDWRADWERYGYIIPCESFANTQSRKRTRNGLREETDDMANTEEENEAYDNDDDTSDVDSDSDKVDNTKVSEYAAGPPNNEREEAAVQRISEEVDDSDSTEGYYDSSKARDLPASSQARRRSVRATKQRLPLNFDMKAYSESDNELERSIDDLDEEEVELVVGLGDSKGSDNIAGR